MITDIIKAVEARQMPGDLNQVKSWLLEVSGESKRMLPVSSCLIATARRNMQGKDDASFTAWAKKELGYNRCYIAHCAKIGDMLLDARNDVYPKLIPLSFDKLLAISRLQPDEIASYASSKELDKLSRDEVRSDVSRILGEAPSSPKKETPDGACFWDGVDAINNLSDDALQVAAETCSPDELQSALDAAMRLLDPCLERLAKSNGKELGPEGMATLISYLTAFKAKAEEIKVEAPAPVAADPAVNLQAVEA